MLSSADVSFPDIYFLGYIKDIYTHKIQMKEGDLIHILGQNDDNSKLTLYGEVVGFGEDDSVEVYLLEQTKMMEGYIWSYAKDWQTVPRDSVLSVYTPEQGKYIHTYKAFGFIPTNTADQFLKVGVQVPDHILLPLELDSDDEGQLKQDEDDDEMADFIVPDEVANEPFTQANPDNDFVRETHRAVLDYNNWAPKNETEKKAKNFIDAMADKYQKQDDNKQFASGMSVDYVKPPV
jgi:hypothetical protein